MSETTNPLPIPSGYSEFTKLPIPVKARKTKRMIIIQTLEGDMRAMPGDWVITGINGEKYPVKDEIFKKTYRPSDGQKCSFCAFGGQARRPCDMHEVCVFEWRSDA